MTADTPPDPFKTVYAPGLRINDHTFLHADGKWHLFHIWMSEDGRKDNVIGHAVSNDLLSWQQQPDVLPKEPAPSWEDFPGANAPYLTVAMPRSIFATAGNGRYHGVSRDTKLIEDVDNPIHEWSFNHYFDALLRERFHRDLLE